jgi:hypothetical protein
MISPRHVMRRLAANGIEQERDVAAPQRTNQPGVPQETRFQMRRNTPETDGRLSGCQNHTGTATMQFFLDLIWDYSCCQHLVALPPQEGEL